MCGLANTGAPGAKSLAKPFDSETKLGKLGSKVDPLGAYLMTGNKGKLDPLNLKNDPDPIPVQPALQESKDPDSMYARRKARVPYANGGTLLTGSSGISNASLNVGGSTLLGG